ncbi:MAG: hypothetical protein FWE46_04460 [Coriobacteriia bacterium]|nr:hypothetical protein [Coriobacteriia bacterium]
MKLFHAIVGAFKNKRTKVRAIIWLGTVLTGLMLVVAIGVSITTTYWFCAAICHYPQTDAVSSYDNSTHTQVACIACHKQPGGDPVSFLMFKVEALFKELPPAIMRTSDMPINPLSGLAMNPTKLPYYHCTQCHRLENRGGAGMRGEPSTSPGIIMDHWAHTDLHITCTACHNRVGHYEGGGWEPYGFPTTDGHDPRHDDFMLMTACYRCHRFSEYDGQVVTTPYPIGQFPGATGECSICHTENFDLVPDNHRVPHFVEDVHGPWYLEIAQNVQEFIDEDDKHFPTYNDMSKYDQSNAAVRALANVPNVRAINYCYTCHTTRFCDDCHGGIRMPHPEGYFRQPHIDDIKANPDSCAICHVTSPINNTQRAAHFAYGTSDGDTCSACHHREKYVPGWQFDPSVNWEWIQHPEATLATGGDSCMSCHDMHTCESCHVNFDRGELRRQQQLHQRGNPADADDQ